MHIINAKYLISSPDVTKTPKPNKPEFAFIGRSNVGKSSLINMLCDNRKLAKTSGSPGKTQMINHYEVRIAGKDWYMVDLPGYGFAKVSQKKRSSWEKMIGDYIRKRENLVVLFVLIDSRHDPQKLDLDFVNRLGEWRVPFSLVFTKADKNKPGITEKNMEAFLKALEERWEQIPQYFVSSAVTGEGQQEIIEYLTSI